MSGVPGHNTIDTGSFGAGHHDRIFVIVVFDSKGILAVFTQGVDDARRRAHVP